MITATNEDNMLMMARYPDDYFDLAIVDPPYMDKFNTNNWVETSAKQKSYKNRQDTLTNKKPNEEYFKELMRVSKNQIIWGGNYFTLPISRGWIFWLKGLQDNYFSDGELAWTSFDRILKCFDFMWSGMLQGDMKKKEVRIHPTQKPVKLYEWLLMNYAKEGDKILDTHRGSASLDIACHNLGFDLVTCELDKDYFNDGNKRLKQHQQQQVMKF
jgi:site-specific DNA-methyltransferase (adenine-specific)